MPMRGVNFPLYLDAERRAAYSAEAKRLGVTVADYIIQRSDKGLPKEVCDELPARKKRGRPKKSEADDAEG